MMQDPCSILCNNSSQAQVGSPDTLVVQEILAHSFERDTAILQDVPSLRNGQGAKRVLFHQKNGHALRINLPDHSEDALRYERTQAERWFIQQQQLRARHKPATDCQHLLLPTAQGGSPLASSRLEDREKR